MLRATFRSLAGYNYRLWAAGALVSNVGTWMQRTAQDWIVFTELTRYDATAVGFVMALQFGPSLLFLPFTGFAADHFDRRRLLILSQSLQAVLAPCRPCSRWRSESSRSPAGSSSGTSTCWPSCRAA
jgi:MFS family permease